MPLPSPPETLFHSQCGRELDVWLAWVRGRLAAGSRGPGGVRYLETGTWTGQSSRRALHLLPPGSTVVTVDIEQKLTGEELHCPDPRQPPSRLIPIEGSSFDPAVVPRVLEALGGHPHAVFIDGLHVDGGPLKDWELWSSQDPRPICVGFHDTGNQHEVSELFWRLKTQYHSFQINEGHTPSLLRWQRQFSAPVYAGIGVLDLEEEASQP